MRRKHSDAASKIVSSFVAIGTSRGCVSHLAQKTTVIDIRTHHCSLHHRCRADEHGYTVSTDTRLPVDKGDMSPDSTISS